MKPVLAFATVTFAVTFALASPYEERRAAALKTCDEIDPARYQTGLYFNPDGYRSFYLRSECFQQAAVRFRDISLCARVRQRRALLSSSWGYSPGNCRSLVSAAIAKDRKTLEDLRHAYRASHMILRDFRIELNGNGRDFDIRPIVAGTTPHGYSLRFEILPEGSGLPTLIHADGYWIDNTTLSIYVRRSDIRQRAPDLSSDRRYIVAATMTLSLLVTTGDAEWSDAFTEAVFPLRERSQTVRKVITFPRELERR